MIRSASEMKLAALIVTASIAFAQPHVTNAQMETRAVSGSLVSAFHAIVNQQTAPAWIGYAAPMIAGDRSMCCWNTSNGITCQGCMLEPGMATFPATTTGGGTVRLEGATEFYVFFRVEAKQVQKNTARFRSIATWTRAGFRSFCSLA